MIALYIKTHRKTGLKYLGKTTQDPFEYQGSGRRWTAHIHKHGYDVDTEVVRWCVDNEAVKAWGIFYSDLFNVVADPNWANLKREEGDGGFDYLNGPNSDNPTHTSEWIYHLNKKRLEKLKSDGNFKIQWGAAISDGLARRGDSWKATSKATKIANGTFGKTSQMNTTDAIANKVKKFAEIGHAQGEKNSQYGSRWVSDGKFNMKLPSDVNTPVGWQEKRVMGLPSIDKELKELLITVARG